MSKSSYPIQKFFYFSVTFTLSLLVTTCSYMKTNYTILFEDDVGDLKENSHVFLDGTKIGIVKDINPQNSKTAVKITIISIYRKGIREKSEFYILGSGDKTHIQIYTLDKDSPLLKPEATVEGSPEYIYWTRKGIEKIEEYVEKGVEKTEEFFESEAWREFKDKTKKEVDRARNKGEEEFKKHLPGIKEETKKLCEEAKKIGEEMGRKVKIYVDSLLKEVEQEKEAIN